MAEQPLGADAPLPTRRSLRHAGAPAAPTPPAARRGSRADESARRPSRTVARLGVLGSLAAVTVVVPVVQGVVHTQPAFGAVAAAGSTAEAAVGSSAALPSTVSALTSGVLSAEPPSSLVAPANAAVPRDATVSRDLQREPLAGCSGEVPDEATETNGHIPDRDLCTLWDGHTRVRADAAITVAQFNDAFRAKFGEPICLASGYRSLADQYSVKAERGSFAATPGTSNHGWGLAIDLCSADTSGARGAWVRENAPVYGWRNPAWAQPGASGPYEPWHWEYVKGVQADGNDLGY